MHYQGYLRCVGRSGIADKESNFRGQVSRDSRFLEAPRTFAVLLSITKVRDTAFHVVILRKLSLFR